ncbi:DUF742 domain-containing protein [Streptomyces sp. TR02-1]|uniref:DUF742 domain-containing protein n=1 Tax=Streptomyces sp. TR02-1 TaxID=3385977 RepID=UPI0039A1E8B7
MTTPETAWATESSEELRPYAVTRGRTHPTQPVDISSYVRTRAEAGSTDHLDEEEQDLVTECRAGPSAVVELAGRTGLPLQVVKILVSDLIDTGFLVMAMPTTNDRPSIQLLERVIAGLKDIA